LKHYWYNVVRILIDTTVVIRNSYIDCGTLNTFLFLMCF